MQIILTEVHVDSDEVIYPKQIYLQFLSSFTYQGRDPQKPASTQLASADLSPEFAIPGHTPKPSGLPASRSKILNVTYKFYLLQISSNLSE